MMTNFGHAAVVLALLAGTSSASAQYVPGLRRPACRHPAGAAHPGAADHHLADHHSARPRTPADRARAHRHRADCARSCVNGSSPASWMPMPMATDTLTATATGTAIPTVPRRLCPRAPMPMSRVISSGAMSSRMPTAPMPTSSARACRSKPGWRRLPPALIADVPAIRSYRYMTDRQPRAAGRSRHRRHRRRRDALTRLRCRTAAGFTSFA